MSRAAHKTYSSCHNLLWLAQQPTSADPFLLQLEMLEILEQVLDRDMNWEEGQDAIADAVMRSHQHSDSSTWAKLLMQSEAVGTALPADERKAPGAPPVQAPGPAPEQARAAPPVADSAQGVFAAATGAVADAVALAEAAGRAAAAATVASAITGRAAGTSADPASAEQKPERSVIERLMHRLGGLFNLGGGLKPSELPQSQPVLQSLQSSLALLPKQSRARIAEQEDRRVEALMATAKEAVARARTVHVEDDPSEPDYPAGPPITMGIMEEYEELMHLMKVADVGTEGLGDLVRREALRFALITFEKRCRSRELGRDPGRLPDNLTVRAEITPVAAPPAAAGQISGQPPAAELRFDALAKAFLEDSIQEAGTGAGQLPSAPAGSHPAQAQLQGVPAASEPEAGAQAQLQGAPAAGEPEAGAQAWLQGAPAAGEPAAGAQATAPVSDAGRPATVQQPHGTPAAEQDPITHQEPAAVLEAQVVVEPQMGLDTPTASDGAPGSAQPAGQQLVPQPAPADAQAALEVKSAVGVEPTGGDEPDRLPPAAAPQADTVEADVQPPVCQEPVAGERACHVWGSKTHAGLRLGCNSKFRWACCPGQLGASV